MSMRKKKEIEIIRKKKKNIATTAFILFSFLLPH
jgi:hypothetical protein